MRALEREAKTQRDLLESYLAKYREASARDNINAAPPEARIISRATPAIKPTYPKKMPTVLIAAFAAFALSAGFTVTGALLAPGPASSSSYGYGYAPAGYGAPAFEPPPMPRPDAGRDGVAMPRMASPPLAPAALLRPCHWRSARWSRLPAAFGRRATPAAASPWSAPCAMSAPLMLRSRSPGRWRKRRMSCWSIWRSARPICR